MYLEGIDILDRNTFINEVKQNREELKKKDEEISNLQTILVENKSILAEKNEEIAKLKALLDSK